MDNCHFLITGGTGLIGSALVRQLLKQYTNVQIILPVRNKLKAESLFEGCTNVTIYECDLLKTDFEFAEEVDYIVHCAAPTDNRFFVEFPIDTYESIFIPSMHLLDYAVRHSVKKMVFLSSIEVYGKGSRNGEILMENDLKHIDLQSPRSSYPLAKRAVEHLCHIYAKQKHAPVSIARLTQTTGPNVSDDDHRVICSFCKCAAEDTNIILYSKGESAMPFCHIDDAISAILTLLKKGIPGEVYNVANESTFMRIIDLAHFIRNTLNSNIKVEVHFDENSVFPPTFRLPLSTQKLQSLDWQPRHSLEDICKDVFNHYKASMSRALSFS